MKKTTSRKAARRPAKPTDLYRQITDRIVVALENGVAPWRKPWRAAAGSGLAGLPLNATTGRHYSGVNVLLLWMSAEEQGFRNNRWMTYRQAQQAGGQVRKGEKATLAVVYKDWTKQAEDREGNRLYDSDGKPLMETVPMLKPLQLFNAEQCEGLPAEVAASPEQPPTVDEDGILCPDVMNRVIRMFNATGVKNRMLPQNRLYHQSGLGALKWENIPDPAREVMAELIARQYTDWFGLVSAGDESHAATAWERLSQYPERSQPCDMLAVIPTRLAAELNGSGGLMSGVSTTTSLYCRQYGMEWPAGHNVNWQRHTPNSLTLQMDMPWLPPSGEVVGEISAVFDCEVRHSYSEPVSGLSGYDCYDGGEHVDGHKGASGAPQPGQVLYLVSDEPASPAQEPASYREVRG
ncbi:ArdC-like ssDNA-binding domain-containing protein [Citrobacter sp. RHBSTW-00229]|nr:ArdC-like ssDNA-binding domain-containing protein [Citrobacter sp. RHBSTW-00229]